MTTNLGFDADFLASFGVTLNGVHAEVKKLNGHNEMLDGRAIANMPRQITLIQESVNATTIDLLDFGGPQAGRKWEVRLLNVISATGAGFVAMANTVTTWYVGQEIPGNAPGILPLSQVRWQFPSVPNFEDFSGDTITVLPREHLLAGLTGIPAAPTQIMVIAVIDDMPQFAARGVTGV